MERTGVVLLLEENTKWGDFIVVSKYPMGGCRENGYRLISEVHIRRTRVQWT